MKVIRKIYKAIYQYKMNRILKNKTRTIHKNYKTIQAALDAGEKVILVRPNGEVY